MSVRSSMVVWQEAWAAVGPTRDGGGSRPGLFLVAETRGAE